MLEPTFRKISSLILFALFAFFFISAVSAQTISEKRNVLIIGISGLRGDAFMAANTPNMDQFMNDGEYSYDCDVGLKTVAGPSWATILTGVSYKKHNVKTDEFKKPLFDLYPHFYKYLENSGLRTASIVNWETINSSIDCCSDIQLNCKIDRIVNEKAVEIMKNDQADVIFLQYSDVDEAGRLSTYHPSSSVYTKAIERMDKNFGEVLLSVKEHAVSEGEQWMIIICSNHGGDGNESEGKQKLTEVRMVPQIMAICGSDGKIGIGISDYYPSLSEASSVNIVPTVLDYLGQEKPIVLDGNSYLMSLDTYTEK